MFSNTFVQHISSIHHLGIINVQQRTIQSLEYQEGWSEFLSSNHINTKVILSMVSLEQNLEIDVHFLTSRIIIAVSR